MSLDTENNSASAKVGETATVTEEAAGPLSFLTPSANRRLDHHTAERQAKRVGFLRIALPLVALFCLGALVMWPVISPNHIAKMVMKNIPDLVIDNLHFSGLDSKNEPYSLNAAKATRPSGLGLDTLSRLPH